MATEPSSEPAAENPDQSWGFQDETYVAEVAAPPGYRPGALTAVCIIAIVLGCMGILAALSSFAASLGANQIQQWQAQMGTAGNSADVRDLQAEMNAKSLAIVNRFRLVNVAMSVFQFALAAMLLAGGIKALGMKEPGRKLLRAACGVAILYELSHAVPHTLMQLENMALMEDYLPRVMEASAPSGQARQMGEFARMMTRFSLIMGWVIFFGWLILKLVFFGVAFAYLGRAKTRSFYPLPKPEPAS
jgi:hypothetical protein